MAAKCKRKQQMGGFAVGCLLTLAVVGAALMGCTPQEENSATGSPAVARSDLAGSAANQAEEQGKVLRSGVFAAGEHPTSGTARLVERDGVTTLELDAAFTTSTSGPDLVVALHRFGDVIGSTTPPAFPIMEGDYVVLAPLESYSGAQSYAIPAEIQTEDFASAVIWCRRFNATFGAARLDPQP
jgi:hypothetical protein